MSAVEIFEQFIDTEIIEYFVNESRRYALFLNRPDPKISGDEIRCFIAILIVSGYNNLPSKRDYWDSGDDMRNAAVFQAMRRNRFLDMCRFIHCADNTKIDQSDKEDKAFHGNAKRTMYQGFHSREKLFLMTRVW
ncbi:hypothetical protein JTB14_020643 [Gonioctena quinquepunctata]|nr:hypothetical protein JTB14_020643 [Gonioctena quinquepunctata]